MFRALMRLVLIVWAVAMPGVSLHAQDVGDTAFETRTDAAFGDATLPLREFLRSRQVRGHRTEHFCIAGYRSQDGDRRAWIYWKEGRKIILWRGATDAESRKESIARSRRITDLKKDVVATEAMVKGSSYLVTKAWVDRLIADCESRGEKYEVTAR